MRSAAVLGVPLRRVNDDIGRPVVTGQHPRQQDAVVVAVRFVAKDRDVEELTAAARQQVFDQTSPAHAVADHHETPFRHYSTRSPATGFRGSGS